METIKNQIKDSEKIISIYKDYFDRLDPLLSNQYDEEHSKLEGFIKQLPVLHKKVLYDLDLATPLINENFSKFEKDIRQLMQTYGAIQTYYNKVRDVFNLFDSNYLSAPNLDSNDMSKTYKLETMDLLNDLRVVYNKYMKKNEDLNVQIIENIAQLMLMVFKKEHINMNDDSVVLSSLQFIQSLFRQNAQTVSMYANFMQSIIDYAHSEKHHVLTSKIMMLIEDDKSFILQGNVSRARKSQSRKNIHVTNPPYKTFGLIPNTDLTTMDKIIGYILKQPFSGKISLPSIAKKESCCFILMTRMTYKPMEYNIRALIDKTASEGLIQEPEYGITQKTISRFSVIKQPKNQLDKWEYKYQIVGNWRSLDTKAFYVIETIDKKLFRLLVPWVGGHSYAIPREKIHNLLVYITDDNKPDRAENYHAICQKQAVGNMFMRRAMSTDIMEENSKEVDTQIMRNNLMLKLTQVIEDNINKNYKKGAGIIDNTNINDIIHDSDIRDTFQTVILSMYKVGTKITQAQEYSAGTFPFSELLASYVNELKYITQRFMKELHDAYNRNPLKEEFKLPAEKRLQLIKEKLNDVLNKTITLIISDKQNIYTVLNYKYLLLNFY